MVDLQEDSGERGRNRTYNLLLKRQAREINDFSDFPAFQVGNLRQFQAQLLPLLLPVGLLRQPFFVGRQADVFPSY